jgi:hypothetical protein
MEKGRDEKPCLDVYIYRYTNMITAELITKEHGAAPFLANEDAPPLSKH